MRRTLRNSQRRSALLLRLLTIGPFQLCSLWAGPRAQRVLV